MPAPWTNSVPVGRTSNRLSSVPVLGDPAAQKQPEGADRRHGGGVAPPPPEQQVEALTGHERPGRAECAAPQVSRAVEYHDQQQDTEVAQPLEGDPTTRTPDPGDPASQRQDRDHGLEDGDQREDRPRHSAIGEEQDRDGRDREQGDVDVPRPARVAAGEPDHRDTGRGPDQPDVLGFDDGDPSQQTGADVCRQPGHGPDRFMHTRTRSFARPHGVSMVGEGPAREAEPPIDTMEP